jgi:uncharacterized protein
MKHKCPICKTATDSAVHADFPFCSERCRERDLGNWASEKYVVSEPIFNEDDSEEGDRKTSFSICPTAVAKPNIKSRATASMFVIATIQMYA